MQLVVSAVIVSYHYKFYENVVRVRATTPRILVGCRLLVLHCRITAPSDMPIIPQVGLVSLAAVLVSGGLLAVRE